MATSRERLARRWSAGRIVLLVVGLVAALLGIAAGLGIWLLPPVLAEMPRERFTEPTRVIVTDPAGSASVEAGAGWLVLGVGPFLPLDRTSIVSPDDVYRADLAVLPLSSLTAVPGIGAATAVTPSTPAPSSPGTTEAPATADAPPPPGSTAGTSTAASGGEDDPFLTLLTAHGITPEAAAGAVWRTETLTSGDTIRYTDIERHAAAGDPEPAGASGAPPTSSVPTSSVPTSSVPTSSVPTSSVPTSSVPASTPAATTAATPGTEAPREDSDTLTVAVVVTPDPAVDAALVIIATTPTADAERYRTVTAALATSALLTRTPQTATPHATAPASTAATAPAPATAPTPGSGP